MCNTAFFLQYIVLKINLYKMKKTLLLLTFLVFGFTQAQTIIYVDVDATGTNDGTSWANAYNSLHDALTNTTTAGAEIWIAEGTYKPVNASTPFLNQYGVNIYGGFVGTESARSDRSTDPWLHPVYLSGDLNGDGAINILDIVELVNIILFGNPNETQLYLGDLNFDQSLNILDIIALVNLILSP